MAANGLMAVEMAVTSCNRHSWCCVFSIWCAFYSKFYFLTRCNGIFRIFHVIFLHFQVSTVCCTRKIHWDAKQMWCDFDLAIGNVELMEIHSWNLNARQNAGPLKMPKTRVHQLQSIKMHIKVGKFSGMIESTAIRQRMELNTRAKHSTTWHFNWMRCCWTMSMAIDTESNTM